MGGILTKCKHNMVKDSCGLCNGYVDKKQEMLDEIREKKLQLRELDARRKHLMELSKVNATRHKELYTDMELKHIIVNTFEVEKYEIDKLYQLAINLHRTLGAIEWMWNYMWAENITDIFKDGMDNNLWERIQNLKDEVFTK
jgi:hypothetical protein